MNQTIIHLISTPRTISTTLMYSFNERPDTLAVDEPYYAYWLDKTGIDHPGRDEVLSIYPTRDAHILNQLISLSSPVLFIKNMAKHMLDLDLSPMQSWIHVFLIRHPAHIIHSMEKVMEHIDATDVGNDEQYRIYQEFCARGAKCIVLKSEDILRNPEEKLSVLCTAVNIPFDPSMMSWPVGPKEIDGSWAQYWYTKVHKSSRWIQREPRAIPSVKHQSLLEHNLPYYRLLENQAI